MMKKLKLGSLASRNEIGGVDAAKVVLFEKSLSSPLSFFLKI